ncbi:recombinase family protein [Streptomyces olivoreticuli]
MTEGQFKKILTEALAAQSEKIDQRLNEFEGFTDQIVTLSSKNTSYRPRAVIYIRVPTEEQVEVARDTCLRDAIDSDTDVLDTYVDIVSAKTGDREGLRKMLTRLQYRHSIEYVFAYRINRFPRDSDDDATLDRELNSLNIELISVHTGTEPANAEDDADKSDEAETAGQDEEKELDQDASPSV